MDLSTILSSIVISGLIAAIVSLVVNGQKISVENVTQERAKWREKIRSQSAEAYKEIKRNDCDELMKIRASFALLLNPIDGEDNKILELLRQSENSEQNAEEFTRRISLLLKHDWERAKNETKFFSFFNDEPKRIKYLTYKKSLNSNEINKE